MKTIEMFLASSIEELAGERKEIESFINALNNIFAPKGVYFKLNMCEHTSEALNLDGMQNKYNAIIRQCEKFYLLIGKEVGQFTKEEFDVALDQLRKTDNKTPKIYTYFRENGDSLSDSVNELQKKIAELRHYWTMFDHIDTVKYKIMLELARDPEIVEELSLKNGVLYSGNIAIESINMDNVPSYANSRMVRELRKKCKALDDKLAVLRARIKEDDSCLDEYGRLCVERSATEKEREAAETQFLKAAKNIVEISTSGELLTERAKEAIELMDKGEYEQARTLLDDDTRARELGNVANRAEAEIDSIRALVKESLLKIDSLKSTGVDQNSIPQIIRCYEEVEKYTEEYTLDYNRINEYALFLQQINRFDEAKEKLERLYYYYKSKKNADLKERSMSCNNLATAYMQSEQYDEAKELLCEALEIYRKFPQDNQSIYSEHEALCRMNLAGVHTKLKQYESAIDLYSEAIIVHLKQGHADYAAGGIISLANIPNLKRELKQKLCPILEFLGKEMERNPETDKKSVALCYDGLGTMYLELQRYEEAKGSISKAIGIYRELAEQLPEVYGTRLALLSKNLGDVYVLQGNFAEAGRCIRSAVKIWQSIGDTSNQLFELKNLYDIYMVYNTPVMKKEAQKIRKEIKELEEKKMRGNNS